MAEYMREGLRYRSAVSAEINRIIQSPTKNPTKSEAMKTLRSCGILNENNVLNEVYKEILFYPELLKEGEGDIKYHKKIRKENLK